MQFTSIPEYGIIKKALLNAVMRNRVAHAQLFTASDGGGNLALALAFATYLNCANRKEGDACGSCMACIQMDQLTHPDLQLIFPSSRKTEETVTLFRDALCKNPFLTWSRWIDALGQDEKQCQITRKDIDTLIERISLKPFMGPYKIVLIWLPEYLNRIAANTLLKTLEEPPPSTLFLLVSMHSEQIPTTIVSRTQCHYIPPFSQEAIEGLLMKKYAHLEVSQHRAIALASGGNIDQAFQLAEQTTTHYFERFSHWMRNCYRSNYMKLIPQAEEFYKFSTDVQKFFMVYAIQWIRIILLQKLNHEVPAFTLERAEAIFSQKFALTVTIPQLQAIIPLLTEAVYGLERNAHAKMVYTHTSIQIAKIFAA